jgi:hypothetical protein
MVEVSNAYHLIFNLNGVLVVISEGQTLLHIGAILRSKYHRKQQRKMFLKSRCCEP